MREAPTFDPNADVGRAAQILDLRRDDQLLTLVELQPLPHQRERVGDVDRERARAGTAPASAARPCTSPVACRARGMPETTSRAGRPSAEGSRSSSSRKDVAAARPVLDVDLHGHARARGDADVGQAPPDGDPLAAPPDEQRGDGRQDARVRAQRPPGRGSRCILATEPHREAGEERRRPRGPMASGVLRDRHRRPPRGSPRGSPAGDRPLMTASAVTMMRCASDGDGERLDVVGDHVVALLGGGHRARSAQGS